MLGAGRAREVSTSFKSESRHLDFYNWYEQKARVTLGLLCF